MDRQKNTVSNPGKGILIASYVAAVIVLMDLTSINIALPSISRNLGLGMNDVSWLIMISMLSASSFAFVAGKITEVWGAKWVLIIGFFVFIVGNLGCFLTKEFEFLLLIRFFQGFGESLLYVVGPAYIRQNLNAESQQKAYGIWMSCTGIGIALGPFIGAFLVSGFSWSYVFLINVPLSIFGLLLVLRTLPQQFHIREKKLPDFLGAVYSFLFLATLIFSLNMVNHPGIDFSLILFSFLASVIFLILFIRREKTFQNPVFDLKLFRITNFRLSALGFFLFFLVNVGSRFLRPFYFENERLLPTETSGLLMMISPVLMLLISPLFRRLSRLLSPKNICVAGNILLAFSMLMFSFWEADTPLWFIVLAMILLGVGMGFYYPSSSYVGMRDLPEGKTGMGSAAISSSKSLGKLMGVLVFATLFAQFSVINADFAFKLTFLSGAFMALIAVIISLFFKKGN